MDHEHSTDSLGFGADESDPGDTGGVQHPSKHGRQKSVANLSSSELDYELMLEDSDEEDGPDRGPAKLVPVSEEAGRHLLSITEIGVKEKDIDPINQLSQAEKLDRVVRNAVESVLDGPGTIAMRVNDHMLDRRGQVDPELTAELKDKMSSSAMIIMNKETHVHRWRCSVM